LYLIRGLVGKEEHKPQVDIWSEEMVRGEQDESELSGIMQETEQVRKVNVGVVLEYLLVIKSTYYR
jgi:hypothetical protein